MNEKNNTWRRRLAVQIAAQLPEDRDDALAVLRYSQELILNFMHPGDSTFPQDSRRAQPCVLELVKPSSAPSLLASSSGSPSALPK